MKRKVQNLSPSDLRLILEKTDPKYYHLFHEWMKKDQVMGLLPRVKATEKIFEDLVVTLPNNSVSILQFMRALSLTPEQFLLVFNKLSELPYYLGGRLLLGLSSDTKIFTPSELVDVGFRFLARLDSNYVSRFSKEPNESHFREHLPLLFPAINATLIPHLWKGVQDKFEDL